MTSPLHYSDYTFALQDDYATRCLTKFRTGTVMCSLVAPPQWGKTGMFISLAGKMIDNKVTTPLNTFVITGLPQTEWKAQTYNRLKEAFTYTDPWGNEEIAIKEANVLKLADLVKRSDIFAGVRNCLIVIDECHIASCHEQSIAKAFVHLPLDNPVEMRLRNIFILNVSATPDNVLYQSNNAWDTTFHSPVIVTESAPSYTSFQKLLAEDRVHQSLKVKDNENELKNFFNHQIPEMFPSPRYHVFRLPHLYKDEVTQCVDREKFDIIVHAQDRKMDLRRLDSAPEKNTIIFIKRFWGCAQTLNDRFIGVLHDTYYRGEANYSSVAQGLAGRSCGHHRNPAVRVFCDLSAIKEYVELFDNGYDYSTIERYNTINMKIRKGQATSCATSYTSPVEDVKVVKVTTDKSSRKMEEFQSQDAAISWALEIFGKKINRRSSPVAPSALLDQGKNPDRAYIERRWWGLNAKTHARMCLTSSGTWVVYGDTSLR
jgi:hypothetical protein